MKLPYCILILFYVSCSLSYAQDNCTTQWHQFDPELKKSLIKILNFPPKTNVLNKSQCTQLLNTKVLVFDKKDGIELYDLAPLNKLKNLEKIYIKNQTLENIPLDNQIFLEKIQWDNNVLINIKANEIIQSEMLKKIWWENLSYNWQSIYSNVLNVKIENITDSDIDVLLNMKILNLSKEIDSKLVVNDLKGITNLTNLQEVVLENQVINSLDGIENSSSNVKWTCKNNILKLRRIDFCMFKKEDIFSVREPIFSKKKGIIWWENIPSKWKIKLLKSIGADTTNLTISDSDLKHFFTTKKLILQNDEPSSLSSEKDDCSFLKNLTQLKVLKLNYFNFKDLSFLSEHRNLKFLDCEHNYLQSLKGINGLKRSLEVLNCSYNHLKQLDDLGEHTMLKYLFCEDNYIGNLKPLNDLRKLNILMCANNNLESLAGIEKLTNLIQLRISNNPRVYKLNRLQNLLKLKNLYCEHNKIVDLSPLKKLTQLEVLNCRSNEIESILPLCELKKLRVLILRENKIKDLSCLKSLVLLENLDFSENVVEQATFLERLDSLIVISCHKNNLTTIPISHMNNLKELWISHNKFANFDFLNETNTKLKILSFSYNSGLIHDDASIFKPIYKMKDLQQLFLFSNNVDSDELEYVQKKLYKELPNLETNCLSN